MSTDPVEVWVDDAGNEYLRVPDRWIVECAIRRGEVVMEFIAERRAMWLRFTEHPEAVRDFDVCDFREPGAMAKAAAEWILSVREHLNPGSTWRPGLTRVEP